MTYIPKHFEVTDIGALHGLIRRHPLGALVTMTDEGPDANHIPFLVSPEPAPFGTLHGHVARANPVWRDAHADTDALVIFQGDDRYISPTWYPTKHETRQAVPTWNYVIVHAHGRVRFIDDAAWLRRHLEALTHEHESGRSVPWAITDAPADYVEQMARALVGVEITVSRLSGKWKVSQNRSERDRRGVIEGLTEEGTPSALSMADLVRQTLES